MKSRFQLHQGDNREVLKQFADNSMDSIVCDPPYELAFMGKRWDSTGIAYDAMLWAECLRVLKPGGHLIAFGGTRTYHRMTVAIEDAGFEIRDCIMWMYGSGFPKSLDVSKAIDKQNGDSQLARRLRFTAWVRSVGLTSKQIDDATGTNMGSHYTTQASQPAIMTRQHLDAVRHLIGDVPDWVEAEVDVRTVESEAWRAREVVGIGTAGLGKNQPAHEGGYKPDYNITAPHLDAAKAWHGWGTAAKPAYEPAILAYKPHDTEHGIIIANLKKLEAQLWLMQFALTAEWNSTSSQHDLSEVLGIAQWTADDATHTRVVLCDQMDTSQCAEVLTSSLSIVQSWKRTWADASKSGSTFITETVLSPIIGWTTLKSSLSHITLEFIIKASMNRDTTWQHATAAELPFVVASEKLKSTLELIAVEHVISKTCNPADIDKRIAYEPAVLARKPLSGTVADNVLAWGVGAVNIDGCRVSIEDGDYKGIGGGNKLTNHIGKRIKNDIYQGGFIRNGVDHTTGRWPANVILDEDTAEALDAQSGISASRFFYTAKASRAEREAGLDAPEGQRANIHATVKPIALMRYLVRLVTPKGGTVLDPFMGSGSTGCAAMLEGMRFVGIDLTPEYVEIAERRIQHWMSQNPMEL